MTPALSRRLGQALGRARRVSPQERRAVVTAAQHAETFEDLPVEVRILVAELESRR